MSPFHYSGVIVISHIAEDNLISIPSYLLDEAKLMTMIIEQTDSYDALYTGGDS